jgi:hypothetical protein
LTLTSINVFQTFQYPCQAIVAPITSLEHSHSHIMAQRSTIRPVSAQPVLRTKKSLPSSLRSVVDIVSSQHAFADSPPAKVHLGGYMSSPRSAVTGNPISITAQKQAEHYLQATTSSTAKNQPSIFEPNIMFAFHFLHLHQVDAFQVLPK